MKLMHVLVACECSGAVRDAFRARGHIAVSCDLRPSETKTLWHVQRDALEVMKDTQWDMLIAFPPCTYLSVSGLHWNGRVKGRAEKTEAALSFFRQFLDSGIPKICIENPVGCASTRIRKPDQIIQPYQFGADASKATCLWLKGLPPLRPTQFVEPRIINGKPRWANQTDSGQNRLGPSPTRAADRARTYQGIAEAMAMQWG